MGIGSLKVSAARQRGTTGDYLSNGKGDDEAMITAALLLALQQMKTLVIGLWVVEKIRNKTKVMPADKFFAKYR